MINTIPFTTKQKMLIAGVLIGLIITGRMAPHFWNATPIIGAILFAGVYLGQRYAFFVSCIAMIVSDLFLGMYDPKLMIVVYGSFALVVLLSRYTRQNATFFRVAYSSVGSSFLFFLTTNWAVWQFSAWYPKTFAGLIQAYGMGVPFLKNALLGDLMYTGMFFGAYAVVVFWYQKARGFPSKHVVYNTVSLHTINH